MKMSLQKRLYSVSVLLRNRVQKADYLLHYGKAELEHIDSETKYFG